MVRSKVAFRFAVRALFEKCERPYFWTFTLSECISVKAAMVAWNKFQKSLYKYGIHSETGEATIFGLRVFELHPGGHGVHIHCLLNRRLPIHAMRKRGRKFGFGWNHVVRVRNESQVTEISEYMSKYMSKQDRPECLKGRRLWAAIGKWGATRCKDIEIESEFVAAFQARRIAVRGEAVIAKMQGVQYRVEHQLETMAWARHHVFRVKVDEEKAFRPDLLRDISVAAEDLKPDLKDWEGRFSNLTEQQGYWSKCEWIPELQNDGHGRYGRVRPVSPSAW